MTGERAVTVSDAAVEKAAGAQYGRLWAQLSPGDQARLSEIARKQLAAAAEQVVADNADRIKAEALREVRDALYRGEGPDLVADADIVYGEWLGNYADRLDQEDR